VAINSRAFALRCAACVAAALAVAGCTSSGSSSGITVTGTTLTIYISSPPQADSVAQDVVDAEELAFKDLHSEVKDFTLAYIQLPQRGCETVGTKQVSGNARCAIEDSHAIAYLGEVAPGASDQTVGITNALDLLQISPTDTALELGQHTAAVPGSPQKLFESWGTYGRTFGRLVPTSAEEASAQVAQMKSLGVTSLYVGDDGSDYGKAIALAVRSDALGAGISLTADIGGAGGVFYGAQSPAQGAKFFNHVSATAPRAKLFGPSSLDSDAFTSAISSSVRNLYVTIPGFMPKQLNGSAKAFNAAFVASYHHQPNVEAVFGYAAMSALLSALKQAGSAANDRSTVTKDFLNLSINQSVLGSYKIDSAGNTSLDAFVIAHLVDGKLVPFRAAPTP